MGTTGSSIRPTGSRRSSLYQHRARRLQRALPRGNPRRGLRGVTRDADRDLEHQRRQGADAGAAEVARGELARHRRAAGDQDRRRGLSAARDRGDGLQRRDLRPEELERRRDPLEASVRRGASRAARRRRRRAVAADRGRVLGRGRRGARLRHLPAQRQSGEDRQVRPTSSSWMDRLHTFVEGRLALEEPFILLGDFNIIPMPVDATIPGELGQGCAVPAREPRRAGARCINLGHGRRAARRRAMPATTRSGTSRRSAGTGEDGIRIDHICCFAAGRRPAAGRASCTRRCAAGTSRATTCRSRAMFAF